MFNKKYLIILSAIVLLTGCGQTQKKAETPKEETKTTQMASEKPKDSVKLAEQNLMAVTWYQTSAEAKALYTQGYNAAKVALDEKIANNQTGKKLAIALDLDETVLDNSPAQAYLVINNKAYPEGWHEWVALAAAEPVYGAKEFLDYAASKGVEIFYITDRSQDKDFEATKKNLMDKKLPYQGDDHLMLKTKDDKTKDGRRKKVEEKYELAMLFGDNLLDFATPDDTTVAGRDKFVQEHAKDFGSKYIVFPNPMYGSWEGTLYNFDFKKSDEEKTELRKTPLKVFNPETNKIEDYQPSK